MKDVLESEVDEKYFIQDDKVIPFIKKHIDDVEPLNPTPDGICRTIKSQYYKNSQANFIKQSDQGATGVIVNERENKPKLIGNIYNEKFKGGDFGGSVWNVDGLAPTLKTTAAASQQCVVVKREQDNSEYK